MSLSLPPTRTLPPAITLDGVKQLSVELTSREQFLRQLASRFERQYNCSLDELYRRLGAREIAEHPAWEDSIEWGNAVDQLAQLQLTQSILAWLINLLTPSKSS